MVNGVARLVKMCRNRSGLDELMVIFDGTTMFAKAFVYSWRFIWSRVPETSQLPLRRLYRAFICENVDPVGRVKVDLA